MGQHSSARVSSGRWGWRRVAIVGAGAGLACATVAGVGIASTAGSTPSVYSAIAPTVVGQYSLAASGNKDVTVAGVDGVPSSATSVQLSVTALNGSATSSLYLYATGATQPSSANLRWNAGEVSTVPITTGVGTNGQIHLHNTTGTAQIKISVIGYYAPELGSAGYAATGSGGIADFQDGGTTIVSLTVPAGTYEVQLTATMQSTDDSTTDQDTCYIHDPAGNSVGTWNMVLNSTTFELPAAMIGLDTTSGGAMTFYCYSTNAHSNAEYSRLVAIKLSSATGYVAGATG
jgi:hypothetical protein